MADHAQVYMEDWGRLTHSGPITFTEEQRQKNLTLREQVQDLLPINDDHKVCDCDLLYRFLIGRHWNLQQAEEFLRNYVQLRQRDRLNGILSEETDPRLEALLSVLYGVDKEGFANIWMAPDPSGLIVVLKEYPREKLIRTQLRIMETARYVSKVLGVDRSTYILDLRQITMSSVNTLTLGFLRELMKILQEYYPELMRRLLFFNTGWAVTGAWKVLKPFVDPRVQDKIRFFNGSPDPKCLEEFMTSDNVLPRYGGTGTVDTVAEIVEKEVQRLRSTKPASVVSTPPTAPAAPVPHHHAQSTPSPGKHGGQVATESPRRSTATMDDDQEELPTTSHSPIHRHSTTYEEDDSGAALYSLYSSFAPTPGNHSTAGEGVEHVHMLIGSPSVVHAMAHPTTIPPPLMEVGAAGTPVHHPPSSGSRSPGITSPNLPSTNVPPLAVSAVSQQPTTPPPLGFTSAPRANRWYQLQGDDRRVSSSRGTGKGEDGSMSVGSQSLEYLNDSHSADSDDDDGEFEEINGPGAQRDPSQKIVRIDLAQCTNGDVAGYRKNKRIAEMQNNFIYAPGPFPSVLAESAELSEESSGAALLSPHPAAGATDGEPPSTTTSRTRFPSGHTPTSRQPAAVPMHVVGELLCESGHPIHNYIIVCDAQRQARFLVRKSRLRTRLTIFQVVGDAAVVTDRRLRHYINGDKVLLAVAVPHKKAKDDSGAWILYGEDLTRRRHITLPGPFKKLYNGGIVKENSGEGSAEVLTSPTQRNEEATPRNVLAECKGQSVWFYGQFAGNQSCDLFTLTMAINLMWATEASPATPSSSKKNRQNERAQAGSLRAISSADNVIAEHQSGSSSLLRSPPLARPLGTAKDLLRYPSGRLWNRRKDRDQDDGASSASNRE